MRNVRQQALHTATRVAAYRIARRSIGGAILVFFAGLWAAAFRRPERQAKPPRELLTVKDLAIYVYDYPTASPAHNRALAAAVLAHVAQEERNAKA